MGEPDVPSSAVKPRRPWLAALLAFFVGPLGHVYAGAPARGFAIFAALQIVAVVMAVGLIEMAGRATALAGLGLGFLGALAMPIDAWWVARTRGAGFVPRRYNRAIVYLPLALAILTTIGGASAAREHWLARAFQIPSGAMMPTLVVGDHLLADMRTYHRADPTHGEVAIFEYPDDPSLLFIKRVVGVPGDQLTIRDDVLFRNGEPVDEPYIQLDDPVGAPARARNRGPIRLGPDEYYLLGDNRHRSKDSRFFGPVKRDAFLGRARVLYWSWDSFGFRVRWERVGTTF